MVIDGMLGNGLSYAVLRNTEPENRIFLRLAVKAGSAMEADDQRGIAHLVEHMAFNGSEHFAEQELVDWFETIGMSFGPEVNAYTGFEETVYMLEIPADDSDLLDTALLVLYDWAATLRFDEEELNKERAVVIEEWRLGRGASGRVRDRQIPFLFPGSLYADRLPIGDPETVRTLPRERIVDFYRTWYRPDLMSVVIVGDLDPSDVVARLTNRLGAIPPSPDSIAVPDTSVRSSPEPEVLIIRDPEIRYTTVQIMEGFPAAPRTDIADMRMSLVRSIAFSAFNARLSEKTLRENTALLAAEAGVHRIVRPVEFSWLGMVPQSGRFEDAIRELLGELLSFRQFGITDGEFERARTSIIASYDQLLLDKDKVESSRHAASLVDSFLSGSVFMSFEDEYKIATSLLAGISREDVSRYISSWYTDRGNRLVVTAPSESAPGGSDIPDSTVLRNLWLSYVPDGGVQPWVDTLADRPLFDLDPGLAGSVVSREQAGPEGLEILTLSNGARVVIYPTAFRANEILFHAWSRGGTSLAADEVFPSASVAQSFAEMSGLNGFSASDVQKKLAGKTVSMSPWIQEYWEGLSGSSSVADTETLFQLIHLYFKRPHFSAEAWSSLHSQMDMLASSRTNDPAAVFDDLKKRLVYGSNIRQQNPDTAFVSRMNPGLAEEFYRARFADASDFTFVFVGSLDSRVIERFALQYLSTLDGIGTAEEARYASTPFPPGVQDETLFRGLEEKSSVFLAFGGPASVSSYDRELYYLFLSLLNIRLRETIREDKGGTYGVSVGGYLTSYPKGLYELTIEFGCETGREDELVSEIFKQIAWLQAAPVPDQYIVKLHESWRRSREDGMRTNAFWRAQIVAALMRGNPLEDLPLMTDEVIKLVSGESMRDLARRYLDTSNYVRAVLKPASAESR